MIISIPCKKIYGKTNDTYMNMNRIRWLGPSQVCWKVTARRSSRQ